MTGDGSEYQKLEPGRAPWLFEATLQEVLETLNSDGAVTRVVGGAVRNTLLGVAVNDVDLATTLRPEHVIDRSRARGYSVFETGIDHGTVTIVAGHHGARTSLEVTTLRSDVETHGRRATVVFSDDWAGDAARRDFTVNAIYCDADGTLHDPVDGIRDIASRTIRFVGDPTARIAEDYLRILRFFRFTAQYADGQAEASGLKASIEGQGGIAKLSAERIRQEMLKLLPAPGAVPVFEAMAASGILHRVCGGHFSLKAFTALAAIELEQSLQPDVLLRLAALMLCEGVTALDIQNRLRLSGKEVKLLASLEAMPLIDAPALDVPDRKVLLYRLGGDVFNRAVLLSWARSGASGQDSEWCDLHTLPARWTAPVFPLAGRDVIGHGIAPGPEVGRILEEIEQYWVDGGFTEDRTGLLARIGHQST